MPKAEIGWERDTEEGITLQVYAQHVGRDWRFFVRQKRFDQWQPVAEPPLEDWLALLDAIERRIHRRRQQPKDAAYVRKLIREKFPETNLSPG
jgi:hypothetical protein